MLHRRLHVFTNPVELEITDCIVHKYGGVWKSEVNECVFYKSGEHVVEDLFYKQ